jgi:hypothetical protein
MMSKKISCILHDFNNRFSECRSDIKTCSYDSHSKHYFVNSEYTCYNFDKISEVIFKEHSFEKWQSVDTILPLLPVDVDSKLYLIEFKNSKDTPYAVVRAKILSSLFLLENFYDLQKDDYKRIVTVTVVKSRKGKKYLENIRQHQAKRSGESLYKVENFRALEEFYGIESFKYTPEKFIEFIENNSLVS